jgi:hypothetical protein
MGILDDAIREHLDLKRQHGAGEGELRELEDEAFGPATRPGDVSAETALAEPPEPGDAAAEAPTTIAEPAQPPAEADEPLPEPVDTSDELPAEPIALETEEHPPPEPPEEPEPVAEVERPTELFDVGESEREEAAEPAAEEHVVPPLTGEPPLEDGVEDEFFSEQSLSDELDQALDSPDVAAEPEPAAEPEGEGDEPGAPAGDAEPAEESEDVLEETPEFLQEEPEGEGLWFEQKPPKDFDFDD